MATIRINNANYSGHSVTISNGRVLIDGKDLTPDSKNINIEVIGDVNEIQVDSCNELVVKGNVLGNVSSTSGDIRCGNVAGNANSVSGDIKANRIFGKASSVSGDISN
jgi:hypothetical protein